MLATIRKLRKPSGFTLVELLVVIAIIGILVALLLPAIQAAREAARRASCQNNLRNVALGMMNYHDVNSTFPPPATSPPPDRRLINPIDDTRLFYSWTIEILPFIEQQNLADQFVLEFGASGATRLSDPINAELVDTEIDVFLCPSDTGRGSRFIGGPSGANDRSWARMNYGYNAYHFWPINSIFQTLLGENTGDAHPISEFVDYNIGMGSIIGPKRGIKNITDGTTNTIMLAEMRVGLSQTDRRGVWAMGMCGSNFHCRHASNLVSGVNSCNPGDDDVYQASMIIDDVGEGRLIAECMMPAPNVNASGQSVVRSTHPGGAFVAMADASVKFVTDFIDAGNIGPAGYIGESPEQILPENFGVWQRLNMSADGMITSIDE